MREDIKLKRMEAALSRENEAWERLRPIREQYGDKYRSVIDIYEIGNEYQIVKYESRYGNNPEILYQPFVNFKKIPTSTYTLEVAILTAISYKHNNQDTQPAFFASRVLNIKDEPQF